MLERHIKEDHKIGLPAAVSKLLEINNKKLPETAEAFTEENSFGIAQYPVIDEIADKHKQIVTFNGSERNKPSRIDHNLLSNKLKNSMYDKCPLHENL